MIGAFVYLFLILFAVGSFCAYKLGHQAGYSKARRDYRQGMKLVQGGRRAR